MNGTKHERSISLSQPTIDALRAATYSSHQRVSLCLRGAVAVRCELNACLAEHAGEHFGESGAHGEYTGREEERTETAGEINSDERGEPLSMRLMND